MDLSILLKNKYLGREGVITGLLEVNVMGVCLIEIYASREPFGFAFDVLMGLNRGPNTVNKFM